MFVGADELRRGLQQDDFEPFFQPIIGLRTGELAGFEILARLRHPRLGLLLPDTFIAVAEAHDLVHAMTGLLLAKAFRAARTLPRHLRLSVNISPHQLRDFLLPLQISSLAEIFHFPLSRLVVEITESALFENLELANAVALDLKSLGCRLSLDDFGTGYSSLLHLQSLPFDELKIDRTFVSSMMTRHESRKIVSAVLGLGQNLGLTTVAEGVGDIAQAAMLLGLGCDYAQGWLYGRPVPADALAAVVEAPTHAIPSALIRNLPRNLPQEIFSSTLPSQRLAQLEALYEGALVGLALLNRELRYVIANRQLAAFHGNPIESYFGRHISEMIPDLYPLLEPYLLRALAGEGVSGIEVVRPADGAHAEGAFLVSYLPVYDEMREVVGVSVSVFDITERYRAEAALRESETHYRHMVGFGSQIPWVFNPQGLAISIGPRWTELTGASEEQSLGHGYLDWVHPDDRPEIEAAIARCFPTGQTIDVQFRARTPSGEWRWLHARGSPRCDAQGNIVCWYGSTEDIDELKRAEEALLQSESRLRALTEALSLQMPGQAAGSAEKPRGR